MKKSLVARILGLEAGIEVSLGARLVVVKACSGATVKAMTALSKEIARRLARQGVAIEVAASATSPDGSRSASACLRSRVSSASKRSDP